jgi:transglutaminase-like putative cysteine protease
MPLTGAIQLGNNPVFDAHLSAAGPMPKYFRMAVYDAYDGAGWQRTVGSRGTGAPGADLADDPLLTVPVSQTIETLRDATEQLYAAPQPEAFSLPTVLETGAERAEVLTVESAEPLPVGSRYDVVSRLSVADEASLRAAPAEDPAWIAARYTAVPETVPARVRQKAEEVASGAATRYDAARAIEAFLRREMTYDEAIGPPPVDRDRVDWFLFETQRGYCDYYASSFVVLARSLGIPARLAAGYARGAIEPSGAYRQRDSDAHTWPEVYFPGYGWIEFEPTASEAPIVRAPTAAEAAAAGAVAPPAQPEREDRLPEDDLLPEERRLPARDPAAAAGQAPEVVKLLRPALAVLVVGLALAGLVRLAWLRPLGGLSAAAGAFARVARAARWLGLGQRPSETPGEYGRRVGAVVPAAADDMDTIAGAYVGEVFGRRASDDPGPLDAAWRGVRRALLGAAGRLTLARTRGRDRSRGARP